MRQHLVEVQPELGQAILRNLDVEFFVLHAEQGDLADVGDAQQLLAHVVGEGLQFGIAEAVGLQRIDDAVDITELVVEVGALHT